MANEGPGNKPLLKLVTPLDDDAVSPLLQTTPLTSERPERAPLQLHQEKPISANPVTPTIDGAAYIAQSEDPTETRHEVWRHPNHAKLHTREVKTSPILEKPVVLTVVASKSVDRIRTKSKLRAPQIARPTKEQLRQSYLGTPHVQRGYARQKRAQLSTAVKAAPPVQVLPPPPPPPERSAAQNTKVTPRAAQIIRLERSNLGAPVVSRLTKEELHQSYAGTPLVRRGRRRPQEKNVVVSTAVRPVQSAIIEDREEAIELTSEKQHQSDDNADSSNPESEIKNSPQTTAELMVTLKNLTTESETFEGHLNTSLQKATANPSSETSMQISPALQSDENEENPNDGLGNIR